MIGNVVIILTMAHSTIPKPLALRGIVQEGKRNVTLSNYSGSQKRFKRKA
jgi:hypothetical protein